jgi:GT2 family glycosyltransferase
MKYSIVIPTYNNCEKYLKPCIDSIIKHTNMQDVELIISANGCTDNTEAYIKYLRTAIPNLRWRWSDKPLGFAGAVNAGIERATTDKIVLLNNDTIILGSDWLERLDQGDLSAVLTLHSNITNRRFGVFFCVMIQRNTLESVGLLDERFEVGGCEDIDYCYRAEQNGFKITDVGHRGDFPIYHKAEGTVNELPDWKGTFYKNELKLAKKYNPEHYRFLLTNNYERAVFLKGDPVFPRETQRYEWAARNLLPGSVLEIGCSTGYGYQFLPTDVTYIGLDYDPIIIDVAKEQQWSDNAIFYQADINTFDLGRYSNIIAFEVVEHLDNGLEIVERLKNHCKRLLITVPHNEPKGFWGGHHKLHGLTEKDFSGFEFEYINHNGDITKTLQPVSETNPSNLMICRWDRG